MWNLLSFSFLFWCWHIPNFDDIPDPDETASKGGRWFDNRSRVAFGTRGPPCDGILIMTRTCLTWLRRRRRLHSVCLTAFAATVPCTRTEKLVIVSTGLYTYLDYSHSYYNIANCTVIPSLSSQFRPALTSILVLQPYRLHDSLGLEATPKLRRVVAPCPVMSSYDVPVLAAPVTSSKRPCKSSFVPLATCKVAWIERIETVKP